MDSDDVTIRQYPKVKIFHLQQTLVKVMSFILLSTVPKKSVCIVKILKPNKNISNYFEGTKRHFQAKGAPGKVPLSQTVSPSLPTFPAWF